MADTLAERIAEMKAAAEKYQDANLNARNWFEYDAAKENFRQECTPAAVLTLVAHVEQLEREVAELKQGKAQTAIPPQTCYDPPWWG